MVLNATFNNISVISSVLLVEVTGENHWPIASHWQTLSHNVVSSIPRLSGTQIQVGYKFVVDFYISGTWSWRWILPALQGFLFHSQGSPHIVKTGRLDFSLSWLKGEVRENLGDFRKSIKNLKFLSPLLQPIHFKLRTVIGIDSLMVCILFGEI
jgi:hypothetical protein